MKKTIFLVLASLLIVGLWGCGSNTSQTYAPKRATIDTTEIYGMSYHIKIYLPERDRREGYIYIPMHFYTDVLTTQYADSTLWKTYSFDDVPFDEMGETLADVKIVFTKEELNIIGFVDGYKGLNGSYKIETSNPNSWGITIIE